jgi:hypothetical protein
MWQHIIGNAYVFKPRRMRKKKFFIFFKKKIIKLEEQKNGQGVARATSYGQPGCGSATPILATRVAEPLVCLKYYNSIQRLSNKTNMTFLTNF